MSDFDFFDGISNEPPIQEFADYYSATHDEIILLPKSIQEFGIELITLMEAKPIEDSQSVIYLKNFLEAFCPKSDNYNGLTQKGKDAVTQIRNSDNEFIKHVIEKVKC